MRLGEGNRPRFATTLALLAGSAAFASPARACEPILPLMLALLPTVNLMNATRLGGAVLLAAVMLKSALFAAFERRLTVFQAALFMLIGNILTSAVGLLAAGILASGILWLFGIPIVWLLCLFPSRRLVGEAPRPWLAGRSAALVATLMTLTFALSCVFFIGAMVNIGDRLTLYWVFKLAAVYCALVASLALTTVWEEWVVWKCASRPAGTHYFASVLRTNVYVLLVLMAVAAAFMLPRRLQSPDFLAGAHPPAASREW